MRPDSACLVDMLQATRDAMEFTNGLTRTEFKNSLLHQNAVLKSLETIGEAASRLSDTTRTLHSEIPWRKIIGMRNRLVHVYFDVDIDTVWDAVQNDLPKLKSQLEAIVSHES